MANAMNSSTTTSMNKLEAIAANELNTIPSSLLARIQSYQQMSFKDLSMLKADLENELSKQFDLLASHNADMSTPLTTSEGFPRDDLDLVSIRLLKRNINILRNDLKDVLERLTEVMSSQFQPATSQFQPATSPAPAATSNQDSSQVSDQDSSIAFARVTGVKNGSPSHVAGLQLDDLIIQFHTVHAANHDQLRNISRTVIKNLNNELKIKIKRADDILLLSLVPQAWDGAGLLGCKLVQI